MSQSWCIRSGTVRAVCLFCQDLATAFPKFFWTLERVIGVRGCWVGVKENRQSACTLYTQHPLLLLFCLVLFFHFKEINHTWGWGSEVFLLVPHCLINVCDEPTSESGFSLMKLGQNQLVIQQSLERDSQKSHNSMVPLGRSADLSFFLERLHLLQFPFFSAKPGNSSEDKTV